MDIQIIKEKLENTFHIGFDVLEKRGKLVIFPSNSNNSFFQIVAEVKNDIRLVVKAEPQKYGAGLLKALGNSSKEKRSICCSISSAVKIVVNGTELTEAEFIEFSDNWRSFELIKECLPFEKGNEDVIVDYIVDLVSMMLSLVDYSIEGFEEGKEKEVTSRKYERNPINRLICIKAKGCKCSVCGFDFERIYGNIGKDYIEVHHTMPVSQMGPGYVVDPVKELYPVCSNCHSMLHRKTPPFSIEEMIELVNKLEKEPE